MIPLERMRSEDEIHENFYRDNKKDFERELMIDQRRIVQGVIEKHPFKSARWKAAKEQLIAETGGKCAYCEAPTTMVAYGDVEHYRPKSRYWWLAYCYDNYLVSCQLCNQKFKKARFPIKNGKMRGPTIRRNTTDAYIEAKAGAIAPDPLVCAEVSDFTARHQQERPLLLNPYCDDPRDFFAWRADDALREVEVIPLPTNPAAEDYCNAAIAYYGLNRKELRVRRWEFHSDYQLYKDLLNVASLNTEMEARVRQQIADMKASNAPFAGMIRYFDGLS